MKKYIVPLKTTVFINVTVDANNKEEALDLAYDLTGGGLTLYCGNGGQDKLCGTREENVSLEPSEEIEEDGVPEIIND